MLSPLFCIKKTVTQEIFLRKCWSAAAMKTMIAPFVCNLSKKKKTKERPWQVSSSSLAWKTASKSTASARLAGRFSSKNSALAPKVQCRCGWTKNGGARVIDYKRCGTNYKYPSGRQGPGTRTSLKGDRRTAYLPNNKNRLRCWEKYEVDVHSRNKPYYRKAERHSSQEFS